MRILYYSAHEILEYDEINLFRSLGHEVFSMGCVLGKNARLRPQLEQDDQDGYLTRLWTREGCVKGFKYFDYVVTKRFIEAFDIVVVMSDAAFIHKNWEALRARPVVWRTVGMAVEENEYIAAEHRKDGLKIVRYSPAERRNKAFIGEDALIRFSIAQRPEWHGRDPIVLTFANDFARRYPAEYAFFQDACAGLNVRIGGAFNESLPNAIGIIDSMQQESEMSACRAYFYSHGVHIPYTLNFLEAWASGIPVVARDPRHLPPGLDGMYSEIADLIEDGKTGFLVKSEAEAAGVLNWLITHRKEAAVIGARGRERAYQLYGEPVIAKAWQTFFAAQGL